MMLDCSGSKRTRSVLATTGDTARTAAHREYGKDSRMSPAQQQQFEQFWRQYPRKVAKLAAQREWERRQPDLDTVLQALAQQRQQWTDMKFTPHARTLAVAGTLAGWQADAAPAVA